MRSVYGAAFVSDLSSRPWVNAKRLIGHGHHEDDYGHSIYWRFAG